MTSKTAENVVEIRVDDIAQLFHTLDPFPFREKDLDREAEEYIVGWARELPADQPFRIIVHLPDDQSQADLARDLPEALSNTSTVVQLSFKATSTSCSESGADPL